MNALASNIPCPRLVCRTTSAANWTKCQVSYCNCAELDIHVTYSQLENLAVPRKSRFHVDTMPEPGIGARHLSRQEFGRRLYQLMIARGWNQSELARQSDMPRDSVSTYIRGKCLPTPKSLSKLATALGMAPADLLPNSVEAALDEDVPSLELKVSTSAPAMAWLRVNRLMSLTTAAKVIDIIEADNGRKGG